MSSKADGPLSTITSAADMAEEAVRSLPVEDRISDLESQIAKIEPLLEQLQKNAETSANLAHYIKDLRAEQVFFNKARYWLAAIAVAVVILLILLLWIAIWHSASPLLKAPPAAIAAVILGIVSGIVLLVNSFAKGVFRSTAERHADGFFPPALDAAVGAYKKITGKGD